MLYKKVAWFQLHEINWDPLFIAASIDKDALEAKDPYEYLKMLVFLEDGTFGTVMRAEKLRAETRRHLKELSSEMRRTLRQHA